MRAPHAPWILAGAPRRLGDALVAGIVCEADYVFIPEYPPETNWPEQLCTKLKTARDVAGQVLIQIDKVLFQATFLFKFQKLMFY